jgi:hypothetical protein
MAAKLIFILLNDRRHSVNITGKGFFLIFNKTTPLSHRPQRKEKDCLNCGTVVLDRYCHHCGQENTEPGMTVIGLVQHFFYDITHFDGKFFDTTRHLITKPGFLSLEFLKGRRAAYLDPIRMYVFTSAAFFLLFYSFFLHISEKSMQQDLGSATDLINKLSLLDSSRIQYDINNKYIIRSKKDTILNLSDEVAVTKFRDSVRLLLMMKKVPDSLVNRKESFNIFGESYKSKKEYDSVQQALDPSKRDRWMKRLVVYRQLTILEEFNGDASAYLARVVNSFLHSFPTLLFISLPLLALLLKLLYVRHDKIYLVNHGVYLIHLYIFTFLVMLLFFSADELERFSGWSFWGWVQTALLIWVFLYTYKAMRRFYGQSRGKTMTKYFLLLIGSFIITVTLFGLYFAYTALKV